MGSLGTEPITGAQSQETAKAQISVGAGGPLSSHDLTDPRSRHAHGLRQPVLTDLKRLQKLLIAQFPWGDRSGAVNDVHQGSSTCAMASEELNPCK